MVLSVDQAGHNHSILAFVAGMPLFRGRIGHLAFALVRTSTSRRDRPAVGSGRPMREPVAVLANKWPRCVAIGGVKPFGGQASRAQVADGIRQTDAWQQSVLMAGRQDVSQAKSTRASRHPCVDETQALTAATCSAAETRATESRLLSGGAG